MFKLKPRRILGVPLSSDDFRLPGKFIVDAIISVGLTVIVLPRYIKLSSSTFLPRVSGIRKNPKRAAPIQKDAKNPYVAGPPTIYKAKAKEIF